MARRILSFRNIVVASPELEGLRALSRDPSSDVRLATAEHIATLREVLITLARDADENARYWVTSNTNAPPELLKLLADDPDWEVREW